MLLFQLHLGRSETYNFRALACTEDLKICPDGSYVGRDSQNNCEFLPCPQICTNDVKECPDGTFLPRGTGCKFPSCDLKCCDPRDLLENPRICSEGCQCCGRTGQWVGSIGDGRTFTCAGITQSSSPYLPPFGKPCPVCDSRKTEMDCIVRDSCVWLPSSGICAERDKLTCPSLTTSSDCHNMGCTWHTGADVCMDTKETSCSLLKNKQSCVASRERGCRWGDFDGLRCIDESTVNCRLLTTASNCRKMKNCLWSKEKKTCQLDDFSRCRKPDCSLITCKIPKCDDDTEDILVPDGQCCPICVRRKKCRKKKCRTELRCFEGEKIVTEPGGCCPVCKKACPCGQIDCSKSLCPIRLCGPDEVSVTPPGECCNKCIKKAQGCDLVDCSHQARCSDGEVVVSDPGSCCPVCRKGGCLPEPFPSSNRCNDPDCSAVTCLKPICDEEEEVLDTADGDCCPRCFPKQDCRLVKCAAPNCGKGEVAVKEPGACCAVCKEACPCKQPNCSAISCLKPICGSGEELVTPDGECCPICARKKPDCSDIPCPEPICSQDEVADVLPGTCCKVCRPACSKATCSDVRCVQRRCPPGHISVTPKGECCPVCIPEPKPCDNPDCSTVLCLKPICDEEKEVLDTADGDCCPRCFPKEDCRLVRCAPPNCGKGEVAVKEPGACCEVCKEACPCKQPNCSAISCLKPICGSSEELVTPAGECCPICVRKKLDCSDIPCPEPICSQDEVADVLPGTCCKVCRPACSKATCSNVRCVLRRCPPGQIPITPKGECCPVCVPEPKPCDKPDCSAISCLKPICEEEKEVLDTADGDCCPRCFPKQDCRLVKCAAPNCSKGEVAVKEPGACCEICKKACP